MDIHRLGQEAVDAGGFRRLAVLGHDARGKGDDRQPGERRVGANNPSGLQAVHHRHLDVHQRHIDRVRPRLENLQRLLAVARQGGQRALLPQRPLHQQPVERAVIDHQHPQTGQPGPLIRRRLVAAGSRGGLPVPRPDERNLEPEGAALAHPALDADGAAHQLDQTAGNDQAQSGAAIAAGAALVGLREGAEQAAYCYRINADTGIPDLEPQPRPLTGIADPQQADRHLALFGELERVADQIGQDLLQPQGIAQHGSRQLFHRAELEPQALVLGRPLHQVFHLPEAIRDREGFLLQPHLIRLDAGQVEDVVDDANQRIAGRLHLPQNVLFSRIVKTLPQELAESQDGIQRCPQLMAHVRQELTLGGAGLGQLAGAFLDLLLQRRVELADGLLLLLAGADVAQHMGIAAQGHLQRKTGAIPAQPDELMPRQIRLGLGSFAFGERRRNQAGQFRQRPAQQLGGRIAEHARRRRIAQGNATPVIRGDDAVGGGVQHGFQLLLAFAQLRLQAFARLDLALQLVHAPVQFRVQLGELARAGQFQRLLEHRPQHHGGGHRNQGRQRLDQALGQIVGMPQRPDIHEMRGGAGQDEGGEQDEHPREHQILAPLDEQRQRHRYGQVGQRDQAIGHHMQEDQRRLLQQTKTVRQKALGSRPWHRCLVHDGKYPPGSRPGSGDGLASL